MEKATPIDLFDELSWHRWLVGDCPEIVKVAILSPQVAKIIGAQTTHVLAARHCMLKIRLKHKMEAQEAMRIMDAAMDGAIVWNPMRPGAFQFHHRDQVADQRYKLVLKVVSGRPEVWLSTFFHSDEKTFKAAIRRGNLLKE